MVAKNQTHTTKIFFGNFYLGNKTSYIDSDRILGSIPFWKIRTNFHQKESEKDREKESERIMKKQGLKKLNLISYI